jgi:ribosomal protein S18 acetylase RimI-like enzyme
MREISLRPITGNDFEFLRQLHKLALKSYITQTWGWDEAWQRREFTEQFNSSNGEIVAVDGTDAGLLWVSEKPTEVKLASIRRLPQFQNQGLGTRLIKDVIRDAQAKGKPVVLHVLKVNPARRLYERLGFTVSEELEWHFPMRTE